MRDWDIDHILGQTPCLCGAIDTWHQACFTGKTREQVHAEYDAVYKKLKKRFAKVRANARQAVLDAMRGVKKGPSSTTTRENR